MLASDLRERLTALLAYPDDTAGALADPLALALAAEMTVADAQRQLHGSGRHVFYYLYVVARDRTLLARRAGSGHLGPRHTPRGTDLAAPSRLPRPYVISTIRSRRARLSAAWGRGVRRGPRSVPSSGTNLPLERGHPRGRRGLARVF